MRYSSLTLLGCTLLIVGVSAGQTPPVSATIACEELHRIFGGNLATLGHPYWARVNNTRSDYWTVSTSPTPFGTNGSVDGSVIALFDSQGTLIAQNEFASPTTHASVLIFGSAWTAGRPGSPVMLTIGADYYLGVAGSASVFSDGFSCNMSNDRAQVTGMSQPAPGAGIAMLLGGAVFLRRKR